MKLTNNKKRLVNNSMFIFSTIFQFQYRRDVLVRIQNLVVAKIGKHRLQVHSGKVVDVQLLTLVAAKMVSDRIC